MGSVNFRGSGTYISDSIYEAAVHINKATNPIGRRVIIVITDDEDVSESLHSKQEIADQLFESGATVYGLLIDCYYCSRVFFFFKMSVGTFGNTKYYAEETGGLVLDGRKRKAVEKLTELINLLRQRYSFGYISTNPQMDGKFRKIKLRVTPEVEKREGGVAVLAKQGYYARRHDNTNKPAQEKPPAPKSK